MLRRLAVLLSLLAGVACDRDAPPAPSPVASSATAIVAAPPPSASASASASAAPPEPEVDRWVEEHLRALKDDELDGWLDRAEELRMQVLVSIVEPQGDGPPKITEHGFRVDAEYIYPASAIKTLLAVSALRRLKVLGEEHEVKLHVGSRFKRCDWGSGKCEVPEPDEDQDEDDDIDEEKRWVGREIHKLLSYSDNHSYDRLYDLVGHEALNRDMKTLGLESVRFRHRLVTISKRRQVRRVIVYPWPGRAFILPPRTSEYDPGPTPAAKLTAGKAYRGPRGKVEEPFDFGPKNYASLRDMHRVTQSLVLPGSEGSVDLGIDEEGRAVILKAMTGHLHKGKHGATHKPLLPGLNEVLPLERLRYVNKAGRAYGFHLDSAYVEDGETKRAFIVTTAIYANPNGVLNDDDYAYKDMSKPFLAAVGESLARAVFGPPVVDED